MSFGISNTTSDCSFGTNLVSTSVSSLRSTDIIGPNNCPNCDGDDLSIEGRGRGLRDWISMSTAEMDCVNHPSDLCTLPPTHNRHNPPEQELDQDDFVFNSMMCGNGTGKSGIEFENGSLYCAPHCGAGAQGYQRIQRFSINITLYGTQEIGFRTKNICSKLK